MHHTTFDTFTRRSAKLLDRRALLGGVSAALLAPGLAPLDAEGKKGNKKHGHGKGKGKGKGHGNGNGKGKGKSKACKKRVKACLREELPGCEPTDDPSCPDGVRQCCKKACKSQDEVDRCLENVPA